MKNWVCFLFIQYIGGPISRLWFFKRSDIRGQVFPGGLSFLYLGSGFPEVQYWCLGFFGGLHEDTGLMNRRS